MREASASLDYRSAKSVQQKLRWQDPVLIAKHSEIIKGLWHNTNYRETITTSNHIAWSDRERLETASIRSKQLWSTPGMRTRVSLTTDEFIQRAVEIWGDKYDYGSVDYIHTRVQVVVKCKKHGDFKVIPMFHLRGSGCPRCSLSYDQSCLVDLVKNLIPEIEVRVNDRTAIRPLELDVYVPSLKVAFEFNSAYYHSYNMVEKSEQRSYHMDKTMKAEEAGISLMHINETDWVHHHHIIRSMVRHKLLASERIGARNLTLGRLNTNDGRLFFNRSHLQGYKPATITYGLLLDGVVMSAMSFTNRIKYWEIERYATSPGCAISGGASRLFKAFVRNHQPNLVTTYADRSISDAHTYLGLGFQHTGYTKPGYVYLDARLCSLSRLACQKHKLHKLLGDLFDPMLTEAENMFKGGYRRLWNSGNHKLVWRHV